MTENSYGRTFPIIPESLETITTNTPNTQHELSLSIRQPHTIHKSVEKMSSLLIFCDTIAYDRPTCVTGLVVCLRQMRCACKFFNQTTNKTYKTTKAESSICENINQTLSVFFLAQKIDFAGVRINSI